MPQYFCFVNDICEKEVVKKIKSHDCEGRCGGSNSEAILEQGVPVIGQRRRTLKKVLHCFQGLSSLIFQEKYAATHSQ